MNTKIYIAPSRQKSSEALLDLHHLQNLIGYFLAQYVSFKKNSVRSIYNFQAAN